MIHPHTAIRWVNDHIGYGVFATAFIPKGTIVYAKDELEIEVDEFQFQQLDSLTQEHVDRYSYIDERGVRILSWDRAKYINHSCNCNTMSTGYSFEIAIRDIHPGEEITDEYGLFNIPYPVKIDCGCTECRGYLLPDDINNYAAAWDKKIKPALRMLQRVEQPLWQLVDAHTRETVCSWLAGKSAYRSLSNLKYQAAELAPQGET